MIWLWWWWWWNIIIWGIQILCWWCTCHKNLIPFKKAHRHQASSWDSGSCAIGSGSVWLLFPEMPIWSSLAIYRYLPTCQIVSWHPEWIPNCRESGSVISAQWSVSVQFPDYSQKKLKEYGWLSWLLPSSVQLHGVMGYQLFFWSHNAGPGRVSTKVPLNLNQGRPRGWYHIHAAQWRSLRGHPTHQKWTGDPWTMSEEKRHGAWCRHTGFRA